MSDTRSPGTLAEVWQAMTSFASHVLASGVNYALLGPNSNSLVRATLEHVMAPAQMIRSIERFIGSNDAAIPVLSSLGAPWFPGFNAEDADIHRRAAEAQVRQSDDRVAGTDEEDWQFGGLGNDTLLGSPGTDRLYGGTGTDTVSYENSPSRGDDRLGVVVNLAEGIGLFVDAHGDRLFGIENLIGSAFNDTLIGDAGSNRLEGRDGNDKLVGGAGRDVLVGGAGRDIFDLTDQHSVAANADIATILAVADVVEDFRSGEDRLKFGSGITEIRFIRTSGSDDGAGTLLTALAGGSVQSYAFLKGYFRSIGSQDVENGSDINVLTVAPSPGWRVIGRSFNEYFHGTWLNQLIYGAGGNDHLNGGGGYNRLVGGSGRDVFDLSDPHPAFSVTSRINIVFDFVQGQDKIHISDVSEIWYRKIDANSNGFAERFLLYDSPTGEGQIYGRLQVGGHIHNRSWWLGSSAFTGELTPSDFYGNNIKRVTEITGPLSLVGTDRNDSIFGGPENDNLNGGAGNDFIAGSFGRDVLTGGAGRDTFLLSGTTELAQADRITDFAGSGTGEKIEIQDRGWSAKSLQYRQIDTDGDGTIDTVIYDTGLSSNNVLVVLQNFSGDLDAGDFIYRHGVTISATPRPATLNGVVVQGNSVTGTPNSDTISGTEAADVLRGLAGGDTIMGYGGDDVLVGGGGADILIGGAGADIFDVTDTFAAHLRQSDKMTR